MSEPIKVGDVVQIVRVRHCGCPAGLGNITTVTRIWVSQRGVRCEACGWNSNEPVLYADDAHGWFASVWRLKRIPPLSDLEGKRTEESLRPHIGPFIYVQ